MPESRNDHEQAGGPAQILTNDGTPFKTAAAALRRKGALPNPEQWDVVPRPDGYAVQQKTPNATSPVPESPKGGNGKRKLGILERPASIDEIDTSTVLCPVCGHRSSEHKMGDLCEREIRRDGHLVPCPGSYGEDPANRIERVFWVEFAGRRNKYEPEDVTLSVNGETLSLQRQKKVPLLERFLGAARDAKEIRWDRKPGQERKPLAPVLTFPFSVHGEATREDFEKFLAEGRAAAVAE
jgi:hypothetical protein